MNNAIREIIQILKGVCGLLILDRGATIGIQIIGIVLANLILPSQQVLFQKDMIAANRLLLAFFILVINYSAITYRLCNIKQGIIVKLSKCYMQAVKRAPVFFILLMAVSVVLTFCFLYPLGFILGLIIGVVADPVMFLGLGFCISYAFFMVLLYMTYFLGILIIFKDLSPVAAIKNNFKLMKEKMRLPMMFLITLLHFIPFILAMFVSIQGSIVTFILGSLWFLFCYCGFSIVLYDRFVDHKKINADKILVV